MITYKNLKRKYGSFTFTNESKKYSNKSRKIHFFMNAFS